MEHPDILIANEPRAYREAIAGAVGMLRPHLQTVELGPRDLEAALRQGTPRLVICSDLTPTVQAHAPSWILLYPDGGGYAVTSVGGRERVLPAPAFADLMTVLDGVLEMVGTSSVA